MSPRKPISELTPEEAEARRNKDAEYKKARRAKGLDKDNRGYRGSERIAKQRANRKLRDKHEGEK